jgi:hypothetical protein
MPEKLRNYIIQQQLALATINVLLKNAGISASRGMITTNHPQLGGGIIYSLGDPSNHSTSILVDGKGRTNLWETIRQRVNIYHEFEPQYGWEVKKPKEVIEWLKDHKRLTDSHLIMPTDEQIRKMVRFHR